MSRLAARPEDCRTKSPKSVGEKDVSGPLLESEERTRKVGAEAHRKWKRDKFVFESVSCKTSSRSVSLIFFSLSTFLRSCLFLQNRKDSRRKPNFGDLQNLFPLPFFYHLKPLADLIYGVLGFFFVSQKMAAPYFKNSRNPVPCTTPQ